MAERGSDKLLGEGARILSERQLKQVIGLVRETNVELVGWWIRGQPRPDWFVATARSSDREQVLRIVDGILGLEDLRLRVDSFPLGIPNIDHYLVRFGTLAAPQDPIPA